MKVGIVTITNNGSNYGNQLQNYAVIKCLQKVGIKQVETLFNVDGAEHYVSFKRNMKNRILGFLKSGNYWDKQKEIKFLTFGKKYLNYTKPFTGQLNSDKYDYYICGSDQIWNLNFPCNNIHYDYVFMKFAPKEKCISFSASIGISILTCDQEKILRDGILHFNNVSVREQRGADLIKNISGVKAEVLLDPTMLIDRKEWDLIMKKPKNVQKNYLLCYFLGHISPETKNQIEEWGKRYNLSIVWLNSKYADEISKSAGPREFVYYFKYAKLVCTDSFHGSVFSILYKIPFVVFDRQELGEKESEKMHSRIETLLGKFNLEKRNSKIVQENVMEMSFDGCEDILLHERKKAYQYLKKALNIVD